MESDFVDFSDQSISIKRKLNALGRSHGMVLNNFCPRVECIANLLDCSGLITGHQDGSLRLWTDSANSDYLIGSHNFRILAIVILSHEVLVSSGDDKVIKAWNYRKKAEIFTVESSDTYSLAQCLDQELFFAGQSSGEVIVWDLKKRKTFEFRAHEAKIFSMVLCKDQKILVTGSEDKTAKCWDARTFKQIGNSMQHTNCVSFICENERFIITASWDKEISIWSKELLEKIEVFGYHSGDITSLALVNSVLISSSFDATIKVLSLESFEVIHTVYTDSRIKCMTCVSGKIVYVSPPDWNLRMCELSRDENSAILTGHKADIKYITASNDSKLLLTTGRDNTVRVWDLELRKQVRLFNGHITMPRFAGFNKKMTMIISKSDSDVWVWDIATEKAVCSFENKNAIKPLDFSVSGEQVWVLTELNELYLIEKKIKGKICGYFKRRHMVLLYFRQKNKLR
jgi:WD40 repeat protein